MVNFSRDLLVSINGWQRIRGSRIKMKRVLILSLFNLTLIVTCLTWIDAKHRHVTPSTLSTSQNFLQISTVYCCPYPPVTFSSCSLHRNVSPAHWKERVSTFMTNPGYVADIGVKFFTLSIWVHTTRGSQGGSLRWFLSIFIIKPTRPPTLCFGCIWSIVSRLLSWVRFTLFASPHVHSLWGLFSKFRVHKHAYLIQSKTWRRRKMKRWFWGARVWKMQPLYIPWLYFERSAHMVSANWSTGHLLCVVIFPSGSGSAHGFARYIIRVPESEFVLTFSSKTQWCCNRECSVM